jgi:antitoxin component YwqK of YwqJK toxin-antitoxin module
MRKMTRTCFYISIMTGCCLAISVAGNTLYEEHWPDGAVKLQGMQVDGKSESTWKGWHENGQKHWEGCYADGVQTGLWTWWSIDGQKACRGYYNNGYMTGTWEFQEAQINILSLFDHPRSPYVMPDFCEVFSLLPSQYENGWNDWSINESYAGSCPGFMEEYGALATVVAWYTNDQKYMVKTYVDGKPAGEWRKWYRNGKDMYNSSFPDGTEKGWFSNGTNGLAGTVTDGKKEGKWLGWYRRGTLFWEGCFAGDVQTGLWKRWRYDGAQLCEGYFSNGYMVGTWNHWNYDRNEYDPYRDEEIDDFDLFATDEDMEVIEDYDTLESMHIYTEPAWENWDFFMPPVDVYSLFTEQYGSSATVLVWSAFDRLYMTKTYRDGRPCGIWKKWYPNGRLRQQRDFLSNSETGWYENGKVALCGRVRENQREGVWTGWYDSGRKKWEGVFSNDVLNGVFTRWTEDGSMECTGVLGNGLMTGTWQCWEYNKNMYHMGKHWAKWHAFDYPFFDWPLDSDSYWPDNDDGTNITTRNLDLTCIIRHINGNRHSEYHYRNGLPFGTWKYWKVNGALELVKTHDSSGKRGTIQYYYPDGTPECSARFIDDNLAGNVTIWYPSGQKEIGARCYCGMATGIVECFYTDGTRQPLGEYADEYFPLLHPYNETGEIRMNIIRDAWNADMDVFTNLLYAGKIAQAEEFLEDPDFRWSGKSPYYLLFKFHMSNALYENNQYEKAEYYLHEIIKTYPDIEEDAEFNILLSKVYQGQHKYISALGTLIRTWLITRPDSGEKLEILKAMIVPVVVIVAPVLMLIILVILGISVMRRTRGRI